MRSPTPDNARVIDCLKSLGLTKYEALVYIALLKVVSATASEIHEISTVPRASVYPVLDQLQEKKLISVARSTPKRFAALSPEEGVAIMMSRIECDAADAREILSAIHSERISHEQSSEELIWNVYGIENIRRKLADIITAASHDIRIIAHLQIISPEIKEMLDAVAERADVEIVTHQWEGGNKGKMRVYVKKHPEMPRELDKVKDMMAGGICIVDNRRVLVILGTGKEDAVALFSEAEGFVRFFSRYYNLIVDWAKKPE
ncbi:MAG: helix-turn-helix domain-containing protein [Methanoregula sp.]|nr:helix-turn-helix domain-containing protein [Methanoregula sp.]